MGYSHSWYIKKKNLDEVKWRAFISDCKKLYKSMPEYSESAGGFCSDEPLKLNGCGARKYATFNSKEIIFNGGNGGKRIKVNGRWKDAVDEDLGCETFYIKRSGNTEEYSWCKTSRKPYDLMVCACLIMFKKHFEDMVIIRGGGDASDWEHAIIFVSQIFGEEIGNEFLFRYLIGDGRV